MKKRSEINFSNHNHRVEIFKSEENEVRVDHFQVGESNMLYLMFLNTDRTLTVTGDFGNWVFCRPFHPSAEGYVSDGYWIEKLRMNSHQEFTDLDMESITEYIEELIKSGLIDYGYDGDELNQAKEWFEELLNETEDDLSYLSKAYRDPYKPEFIDYEMIPCYKKTPIQLNIIFDAFDEICNRMKQKVEKIDNFN